jgi:hypothetical protein
MKLQAVIVSVAIVASSLTLANGKGRSQTHSSATNELVRIEREVASAVVKGNLVPFDRYTAPTCVFTDPSSGIVMDKAYLMAGLKSGRIKYQASQVENLKVYVYGNAAVVTFRTKDRMRVRGQDASGTYQWTDTFVKKMGRWQLVADHGVAVAVK